MASILELTKAPSGVAAVLADASVKSAVVLLAAAISAKILRQAPAAMRHRVWSLGVCGALVMPLLSWMLPQMRLPVLPAELETAETAGDSAGASATELPAEVAAIDSMARDPNEETRGKKAATFPDRQFEGDVAETQTALLDSRPDDGRLASRQTAAPLDAWAYVLGVWAAGLAVVISPLATGFGLNWLLLRKSRRLNQGQWLRLIAELSARIGLTRTVTAFESPQPVVPMTWGLLWPMVLVPEDWRDWPQERKRCVLLHELAHVKRLDLVFQIIGRLAAALYWFNPLVWFAVRQLRIERELACDDCVLASGERASDYARELLKIAKLYRLRPLAVGVAMAHSARLDQRVLRILDQARSRLPMSRRASCCQFVASAVLVLGVAATSLVERSTSAIAREQAAAAPQGEADKANEVSRGNVTIRGSEKTKSMSAAMESSLEGLPKLCESVSKSIVRVETEDNDNVTGVIVSSGGHILVGNGFAYVNGSGSIDVKVHLSDGRTATARATGWSLEWRLGVMQINEEGPWPAIELGSTKDLKAGEPCLVIGYSTRGDTKYDSSPMARFAFIDRSVPTRWFTTTGFRGVFEKPAVVGMDGRLLGVDTCEMDAQSYATAVDIFVANRDDLLAGKNLDWVRYPPNPDSFYRIGAGDHPEMLRMRKTDDVLGAAQPPTRMSDSQLSEVRQIAKTTTVRLVSKDRLGFGGKDYDRWSGVIVTEDGYILTCGHAQQLPGEHFTVRLSDGRDADGVALGSNAITDVGLVKITTPGSWPFAVMAESSTLKMGDPLVAAGYPAMDERGEWTAERTPVIGEMAVRRPLYLLWCQEFGSGLDDDFGGGGMSGGGVFNQDGRYVAVYNGWEHTRSELAKAQWDDLKQIESIDTALGLPHPLQKRFVTPSKSVAQSVVELLVDSKPVSIGTIVDADGWILTKASVLDGKASCRLPDQSVVDAEKRAESQEHDLALLKIDVGGLSASEFSDKEPPSIAQILCAVGPGQILKPGIVSIETRAIPPEPHWKGDATEDTEDGPMISRLEYGWQNKTNLSTIGTKLQPDDIIVSINGHSTPSVAALTQVLETNLAGYCTGDLVSAALRRKGAVMNVLTPLPPATVVHYWMIDEHDTPRRSGFAAVFDTDIELLQREVGCPVIDVEGRIRGIAIASRGRDETLRGPTSVLSSNVVSRLTKKLMAEANSK